MCVMIMAVLGGEGGTTLVERCTVSTARAQLASQVRFFVIRQVDGGAAVH